jgi:hypothetical protein
MKTETLTLPNASIQKVQNEKLTKMKRKHKEHSTTFCDIVKEFKETSPILKPFLVWNPFDNHYFISVAFSKKYIESRDLEVIL